MRDFCGAGDGCWGVLRCKYSLQRSRGVPPRNQPVCSQPNAMPSQRVREECTRAGRTRSLSSILRTPPPVHRDDPPFICPNPSTASERRRPRPTLDNDVGSRRPLPREPGARRCLPRADRHRRTRCLRAITMILRQAFDLQVCAAGGLCASHRTAYGARTLSPPPGPRHRDVVSDGRRISLPRDRQPGLAFGAVLMFWLRGGAGDGHVRGWRRQWTQGRGQGGGH